MSENEQNARILHVLCPKNCGGTKFLPQKYILARNTLDCDQSNYSSRIVFSHIPIEFGKIGISAIRSTDPENPILEPKLE